MLPFAVPYWLSILAACFMYQSKASHGTLDDLLSQLGFCFAGYTCTHCMSKSVA